MRPGCSWGFMPSGCQHTQSARQLPENRDRARLRAPNPIGRIKGPVRIRSASPKRTRPWLAGCGDRWRPGGQPRWYNEPPPPPPPPSLVRGQNNPMWSRDDATGCFHMNHSSRSILPVVSAASGENVLIKFTEPAVQPGPPGHTWEPGKLAVHFTHTVNEVERALQKQLNFSPPHTRIVLVSPSCSDGSDHVLTLCRAQSTFKLGIIITEPLDEEYLTQQYFPSAVPIGDYHMVGGRVYQAPGRDARFHTTPCRGHTHANADQHFAALCSAMTLQHHGRTSAMQTSADHHAGHHTHYHLDQRYAAAAALIRQTGDHHAAAALIRQHQTGAPDEDSSEDPSEDPSEEPPLTHSSWPDDMPPLMDRFDDEDWMNHIAD